MVLTKAWKFTKLVSSAKWCISITRTRCRLFIEILVMVCSIFLEVCCDPQYQMPSKSQQKIHNYNYHCPIVFKLILLSKLMHERLDVFVWNRIGKSKQVDMLALWKKIAWFFKQQNRVLSDKLLDSAKSCSVLNLVQHIKVIFY